MNHRECDLLLFDCFANLLVVRSISIESRFHQIKSDVGSISFEHPALDLERKAHFLSTAEPSCAQRGSKEHVGMRRFVRFSLCLRLLQLFGCHRAHGEQDGGQRRGTLGRCRRLGWGLMII